MPIKLGPRFSHALDFAIEVHGNDFRKGSGVPYIGHLLGTAALAIDDGGSEDEAIAALLHDAAEDHGGEAMLAQIEERFGPDVRRIVAACSDTFERPKPDWCLRKADYIASIPQKRPDELRVSLADKVYNARAILLDLNAVGDKVWDRFNQGRDKQLWYYSSLAEAFTCACPGALANELARTVDAIARRAT